MIQAKWHVEGIEKKLEGLTKEQELLKHTLLEARFEQLKEQLEQERIVETSEEVGCSQDEIIGQCRNRAKAQAIRSASEQGAAVLVRSITAVEDLKLTRDEIHTTVEALVVHHTVLDEGFV